MVAAHSMSSRKKPEHAQPIRLTRYGPQPTAVIVGTIVAYTGLLYALRCGQPGPQSSAVLSAGSCRVDWHAVFVLCVGEVFMHICALLAYNIFL